MAISTSTQPALEAGDHLSREEFHRRYEAHPEIKKAELVEGVVYVPAPVRVRRHGLPNSQIVAWLGIYAGRHPELILATDATVRLDDKNEIQPDALLFHEVPGGPFISDDDYIEGPPQLVVEIAASSASYDLHSKKEAYRRNRVREYVVWRTLDHALDWFRLVGAEYVRIEPDSDGIIESDTFPGLRLHIAKLLAGNLAGVLAEVG